MNTEIDRELLIRYINDKCTAEELSRVQQFLQNPQWQQALENLLREDYSLMDHQQADETDLEKWNQEFRDKYFKQPPVRFLRTAWIGYAATLLVMLGIGGYFLNIPTIKTDHTLATVAVIIEKTNPRGVRSKIMLPDSSVVYLGAGSSISFPERFAAKERTLNLRGEAFFEITKNPKRPFVIHTGEIQTTVLGTSFKITAFKDNPISVEVTTGKVRVARKEHTKVAELAVLTPGEGVVWDKKNAKEIHTDISTVKAWAKGEISFKNRSLSQIAAELENAYDVKISFAQSANPHKRFSLSVDGTAPLTDALDIICNTAHLEYHINANRRITISSHK